MHKVIALIQRKPGLSRGEFIDYYESSHAPLAKRVYPQIVQYRRNFIELADAIMAPGVSAPDFDSVTEIWYRDRDAIAEMLSEHFAGGEVGKAIDTDERNFLDQSMTRFFTVDERGANNPNASVGPGHGHFKAMALLTVKPGLSRAELVDYYETKHSKLIWSLFPWIVEYRRNFVDLEGSIIAPSASNPDFDVVTELWFKNRGDFDRMLAAHANPEIGGAVAADEANCFDRTKTRFFAVEERVTA